jgi:hypothetical protein
MRFVSLEDVGKALARRRKQELVAVDEGGPPRPSAQMIQCMDIRLSLSSALPRHGPVEQLDDARLDPGPKHLARVVGTEMVVKQDMVDTLQDAEGEPFVQIAGFILEDRDRAQVQGGGPVDPPGRSGMIFEHWPTCR